MQILEKFQDLPLILTVEVGVVQLNVLDAVASLREGSILTLDRAAGAPLDIVLNGTVVARGVCELSGERVNVRVLEVASTANTR